jgi:hypothetical protein
MQVKEFAQNSQQFSVHDITSALRNKTAQGDLEIPEVEVQGASFRFDIQHVKVKALFDELWRTGVFDPDFSLSRQFNGMYFQYTPSLVGGGAVAGISVAPQVALSAGPAVAPVASATNANNVGQNWGNTTPVVQATVLHGKPTEVVIGDRVRIYLDNCVIRNFRPTLKQVQSAIKRDFSTGWSCDDLKALVQKIGYTVVDNPDNVSKAQVVTV